MGSELPDREFGPSFRESIANRNCYEDLMVYCKYPTSAEMEEHPSCHICYDSWTSAENGDDNGAAESPIKLPCNHLIGENCIIQWIFSSSHDGSFGRNSCPECRRPILPLGYFDSGSDADDESEYDESIDVNGLATFNARIPIDLMGFELDGDKRRRLEWAQRAETLWVSLCEELVSSVEQIDDVDEMLYGYGAIVLDILQRLSAERFYAVNPMDSIPLPTGYFEGRTGETWEALRSHLEEGVVDVGGGSEGGPYFLKEDDESLAVMLEFFRRMRRAREALVERTRSR